MVDNRANFRVREISRMRALGILENPMLRQISARGEYKSVPMTDRSDSSRSSRGYRVGVTRAVGKSHCRPNERRRPKDGSNLGAGRRVYLVRMYNITWLIIASLKQAQTNFASLLRLCQHSFTIHPPSGSSTCFPRCPFLADHALFQCLPTSGS